MRYLPRITLPSRVLDQLASYQKVLVDEVEGERRNAPKLAGKIEVFWKRRRSSHAMRAVDRALRAMASGLARCMYCEDSQGCDVEHGYPKVAHIARVYEWSNLLWVCAVCNREKNDFFDEAVIDPTREDPLEHLVLSFSEGRYRERDGSRRGSVTLKAIPRLASDKDLVTGRQNAVEKLRLFLREYDKFHASGDDAKTEMIRKVVVEEPFSAAFAAMLRASREPGATDVLGAELMSILSRHPSMYSWLKSADDARVAAARPEIDRYARTLHIRAPRKRS